MFITTSYMGFSDKKVWTTSNLDKARDRIRKSVIFSTGSRRGEHKISTSRVGETSETKQTKSQNNNNKTFCVFVYVFSASKAIHDRVMTIILSILHVA